MVAVDMDGDEKLDLVALDQKGQRVSILRNKGNGSFTGFKTFDLQGYLTNLVAADLDGDGKKEVIIGSGSGAVSVLSRQGIARSETPVGYLAEARQMPWWRRT